MVQLAGKNRRRYVEKYRILLSGLLTLFRCSFRRSPIRRLQSNREEVTLNATTEIPIEPVVEVVEPWEAAEEDPTSEVSGIYKAAVPSKWAGEAGNATQTQ